MMEQTKTALDRLYETCRRFDEGVLAQQPGYREMVLRMLELERELREKLGEEEDLLDRYLECASCDTECERRHYFAEGFRLGHEAGKGNIHSGLERLNRTPGT